ncbi:MAG: hypothetical protein AMS25_05320 [Gemmatimonas sp. SM23_52]|nr:MAG: hypothetical protein AMS25_05320 [Gemmatimonas sp. SM23_52]
MRLARALLIGLLGVGLLVGCDEDGTGPAGFTLADLVGTWDASVFVFVSQSSPPDSADFIAEGADVRLTVAANGGYSIVVWTPELIADVISGTVSVDDGDIVITEGDGTISFSAELSGNTLSMHTDEVDFDFGDGDEPAELQIVFQLKTTGTLIDDLVGDWDATTFLFISEAVPPDTFDAIAEGGSLAITVTGDSRYTTILEFPSEPTDTIYGTLLILTGELALIEDSDTDSWEVMAFVFEVVGDTLMLEGEDEFDFGSGDEPATLEIVMERQ